MSWFFGEDLGICSFESHIPYQLDDVVVFDFFSCPFDILI